MLATRTRVSTETNYQELDLGHRALCCADRARGQLLLRGRSALLMPAAQTWA